MIKIAGGIVLAALMLALITVAGGAVVIALLPDAPKLQSSFDGKLTPAPCKVGDTETDSSGETWTTMSCGGKR